MSLARLPALICAPASREAISAHPTVMRTLLFAHSYIADQHGLKPILYIYFVITIGLQAFRAFLQETKS